MNERGAGQGVRAAALLHTSGREPVPCLSLTKNGHMASIWSENLTRSFPPGVTPLGVKDNSPCLP